MDIKNSIESILNAHLLCNLDIYEMRNPLLLPNIPLMWTYRDRKTYPRLPRKTLGHGVKIDMSIYSVLQNRRSIRHFSNKKLSKELFETLLCGTLKERQNTESGIRPYPSAGARYPCETYICLRNTEGFIDGMYYYDPVEHSVTELLLFDFLNELDSFCITEDIGFPNILMVISSVFHRTLAKYGGRGYRYCLIEAGLIAQSLSLICTALGLGSFLIGGFDDKAVADIIDVSFDLEVETPLLMLAIGWPKGNDK